MPTKNVLELEVRVLNLRQLERLRRILEAGDELAGVVEALTERALGNGSRRHAIATAAELRLAERAARTIRSTETPKIQVVEARRRPLR
jgi:hypothetical protein